MGRGHVLETPCIISANTWLEVGGGSCGSQALLFAPIFCVIFLYKFFEELTSFSHFPRKWMFFITFKGEHRKMHLRRKILVPGLIRKQYGRVWKSRSNRLRRVLNSLWLTWWDTSIAILSLVFRVLMCICHCLNFSNVYKTLAMNASYATVWYWPK